MHDINRRLRWYLLQRVMQLHCSEQEALLAPQRGADLLTHSSQLAALGPDGVFSIVPVFYQLVAFTGQSQSPVKYLLWKHIEETRVMLFEEVLGDEAAVKTPSVVDNIISHAASACVFGATWAAGGSGLCVCVSLTQARSSWLPSSRRRCSAWAGLTLTSENADRRSDVPSSWEHTYEAHALEMLSRSVADVGE